MEIYGVGTDIIEVGRITAAIEKGPSFKKRVYAFKRIKTILKRYNPNKGTITKNIFAGSTVGVITAAATAAPTTAPRQLRINAPWPTIPSNDNTKNTKGVSKATPIQKTREVTNRK